MTYEELIVFYFRNDCVVVPNQMITEVFDRKEGTFEDKVAVIVNAGKNVVGLFDEEGKNHNSTMEDLTEDMVKYYLNRVKLKEKYQEINKKLEEIKQDFK